MSEYARNIPLMYIISALSWCRFAIPILALFFIASKVPLEQFTIIMAIFSLSILLLEIPSGIIADLIGKKRTMLIAKILYIVEIYLIAFYNGFWIFLIAKIISGIGVSFWSGADQALIYDTLKRMKKEKDHKKIIGNYFTIQNVTKAFVFIIGGFLFAMNYKLPAIMTLPFIVLSFILMFFIKEPYVSGKKLGVVTSFKHLKESLSYSWKHSYVKYLILYSLPVATTMWVMLSISSAYLAEISIPVYMIGIIAFIASMLTAYISKKAYKIEEKLGERISLIAIQITAILGIFLMSLMIPYLGVLFYLLIPVTQGFFMIIINNYLNEHIETSHRATIISIRVMFSNLGVFILFPLVGYMIKYKTMHFSFLIFGIIMLAYMLLLLIYSRKLKISQINH